MKKPIITALCGILLGLVIGCLILLAVYGIVTTIVGRP